MSAYPTGSIHDASRSVQRVSHGLNERMPAPTIDESLSDWYIRLQRLSRWCVDRLSLRRLPQTRPTWYILDRRFGRRRLGRFLPAAERGCLSGHISHSSAIADL